MTARWARPWFAATAACVVAGVVISILTAAHNTAGHFQTSTQRAFNTFAFFTIQSNLIVGITALLLAVRLERTSTLFRVARLTGMVAIVVTGVVYHVAIARLLDLESWDLAGDQLVHTVVPILAVVGWLMFGPRRLTSARIAWLCLIFPVCWLAFTLIRGAVVHWYPYTFIDVNHLGYAKTIVNCLWVSLLFVGLAAGATVIDRRLSPLSRGR
jgi:hypothetical protein